MNPLEIIMKKMCECAGVEIDKASLKETTWTSKQNREFYNWMMDWLHHSPDVRNKLMVGILQGQSYKKKHRQRYCLQFLMKYGFKIKENEKDL